MDKKQLDIFRQLKENFPKEAYKQLNFGRAMTTIDAYHIVERLNEVFGLCGIGWGLCGETGPGSLPQIHVHDGNVVAFGQLWYKGGETERVEYHSLGNGAPSVVGATELGYVVAAGDAKVIKGNVAEAYKKALTNLISKAASYIGVGFNIYKGLGLDDPYVDPDAPKKYKLGG